MSFYLTVTFEYATREDEARDAYPGENARSYVCEPVSDTPPVVLPFLAEGSAASERADILAMARRYQRQHEESAADPSLGVEELGHRHRADGIARLCDAIAKGYHVGQVETDKRT